MLLVSGRIVITVLLDVSFWILFGGGADTLVNGQVFVVGPLRDVF